MDKKRKIIDEILDSIDENTTRRELDSIKRELVKGSNISNFIRNSELVERAKERGMNHLIPILRKRPMRSVSGIVNLAIMTTSDCPHGRCTYCPVGENSPNSYTGHEPSTMRGIQNDFIASAQLKSRITQLREIGHPTDKCEVIIQGGTFLAQSIEYQNEYILDMYNELNGEKSNSIEEAIKKNESAKHRCIGLTIETRPDWCFEPHVDRMLKYGATRVEIGVQTLKPHILEKVKRGHTIEDVWKSTQVARDSLFKICYHMMPGLYSTKEEDVEMFKELFTNEKYQPDMLKIYPLLIMKNTEMYEEWKRGEINPYTTEEAAEVVSEAYRHFPPYVRVMRVQRDIPSYLIEGGVKKSNLRQIVEERLVQKEIKVNEIRYREVGLNVTKKKINLEEMNPELVERRYVASGGEEVFLSYEDKKSNIIFGFLRLRNPSNPFRKEITEGSAGIRELHIYGDMLPIGMNEETSPQHKGLGKRLLEEAERISKEEWDKNKILVISGVGVRNYYRKLGYELDGPYMSKPI